jgi:ureidoacrylate peracid hydrolase
MQNDFCADGGFIAKIKGRDVSVAKPLAGRIGKLLGAARAAGVMPIWIRAIYDPKYLSAPVLAKQEENGVAGIVVCGEGTWGAGYFEIAPTPGEFEVVKHRYSAFSCTELDNILRDHNIRTLVFSGVQTNVCVESTLRDGLMNGYYTVVPADCVASDNAQLHEASLANIRALFGDVTDCKTLIGLWSKMARLAAE